MSELPSYNPETQTNETSLPYWYAGYASAVLVGFAGPYIEGHLKPQLEGVTDLSAIQEFGLYHSSDFDNAFTVAAVFDLVFNQSLVKQGSVLMKKNSALLASSVSMAIFTAIEWEDKKDLPAAYLGAWTYAATRISYLNNHFSVSNEF